MCAMSVLGQRVGSHDAVRRIDAHDDRFTAEHTT
jgi:hypothetical protein